MAPMSACLFLLRSKAIHQQKGVIMKKLYVGNFSFSMTDLELQSIFEPYGVIESAKIVTNPETGKSRGFALVAMLNDDEADKAIAGLNGKESDGRALTVNEARKNSPRNQ
jgi:cold-inducible RNA-binding protein